MRIFICVSLSWVKLEISFNELCPNCFNERPTDHINCCYFLSSIATNKIVMFSFCCSVLFYSEKEYLSWKLKDKYHKTRMTTFIKEKFKQSDEQTHIHKDIEELQILQNIILYKKKIFWRISITKFIVIRQLFHVKNVCINVKNQHV